MRSSWRPNSDLSFQSRSEQQQQQPSPQQAELAADSLGPGAGASKRPSRRAHNTAKMQLPPIHRMVTDVVTPKEALESLRDSSVVAVSNAKQNLQGISSTGPAPSEAELAKARRRRKRKRRRNRQFDASSTGNGQGNDSSGQGPSGNNSSSSSISSYSSGNGSSTQVSARQRADQDESGMVRPTLRTRTKNRRKRLNAFNDQQQGRSREERGILNTSFSPEGHSGSSTPPDSDEKLQPAENSGSSAESISSFDDTSNPSESTRGTSVSGSQSGGRNNGYGSSPNSSDDNQPAPLGTLEPSCAEARLPQMPQLYIAGFTVDNVTGTAPHDGNGQLSQNLVPSFRSSDYGFQNSEIAFPTYSGWLKQQQQQAQADAQAQAQMQQQQQRIQQQQQQIQQNAQQNAQHNAQIQQQQQNAQMQQQGTQMQHAQMPLKQDYFREDHPEIPVKRRINLPKDVTNTLRSWLSRHVDNPYPTEEDKQRLMRETGLTMVQLSNWFINARRRVLPPSHRRSKARQHRS